MAPAVAVGVAVLGAAGCLCRWGLSAAIQKRAPGPFPLGTFVVNAAGSLAIGVVMGFFLMRQGDAAAAPATNLPAGGAATTLPSPLVVALTAGFMGGFTTYSSFAYETISLIERRSFLAAVLNIVGTLAVCLVGCALGLFAGRALGR